MYDTAGQALGAHGPSVIPRAFTQVQQRRRLWPREHCALLPLWPSSGIGPFGTRDTLAAGGATRSRLRASGGRATVVARATVSPGTRGLVAARPPTPSGPTRNTRPEAPWSTVGRRRLVGMLWRQRVRGRGRRSRAPETGDAQRCEESTAAPGRRGRLGGRSGVRWGWTRSTGSRASERFSTRLTSSGTRVLAHATCPASSSVTSMTRSESRRVANATARSTAWRSRSPSEGRAKRRPARGSACPSAERAAAVRDRVAPPIRGARSAVG